MSTAIMSDYRANLNCLGADVGVDEQGSVPTSGVATLPLSLAEESPFPRGPGGTLEALVPCPRTSALFWHAYFLQIAHSVKSRPCAHEQTRAFPHDWRDRPTGEL